ncbi:hypothetical protein PCC9214_00032 [Planktothrix tepida]|uniref:Uncharacterized protein n=1 Tax=Planktothrix tepida PCC 9214 TaxID=671072 RepID=A0A1J1LJM1_9CYAN|nr:hypothetical protein [Planktothrix tepida]CAD5910950.1 hypothetical protein PCC9214_00032 [Planktothrix tepida]CUR32092.1 conserved membrane hypothetical protein [Planktothrix tepida PCC 9214]
MKIQFNYGDFGLGLTVVLLLTFSVLHWLHIPAGSFLDWVIGCAVFWWLLLIVTVPWNIHFEAKEVLAEAEESRKKGIFVEEQQVQYVTQLAQRSLWVALGLHLLSTIGLYGLAWLGISVVGYWGAGAALLLTILRPSVRAYQYLATRLAMVRRQFSYPREDVVELRNRFEILETTLKELERKLNLKYPDSWATQQEQKWQAIREELTHLTANLETLKATNQSEHHRLQKEAENAIAQLSADGQFLNHVREIIRFVKEA